MRAILLLLVITLSMALSACNKDRQLESLNDVKAKLAFTCVKEKDTLAPPPTEADVLFQYARFLDRHNLWTPDPAINAEIARLYRIASANGHYKASINLQIGIMQQTFFGTSNELVDWADELIKAKIPAGYFLMGKYIKNGTGGVKKDEEMAMRYFRHAADLGNPDAQYYVGDKLEPIDIAPEVAIQMYQCAAEQGHGKAALALGTDRKFAKDYPAAIRAFQLGAAGGNETAAYILQEAFRNPRPIGDIDYLDLDKDEERAARYEKIGVVLGDYYYADPKITNLNHIIPLPPAPLPEWDGTVTWLKEFEAKIAPPKPSEELIAKLATAKGLDPDTGVSLAEMERIRKLR